MSETREQIGMVVRQSADDLTPKLQALIEKSITAAYQDYIGAVTKFDACRGMLARVYVHLTGNSPNPPDDYKGAWHEWLIDKIDNLIKATK